MSLIGVKEKVRVSVCLRVHLSIRECVYVCLFTFVYVYCSVGGVLV